MFGLFSLLLCWPNERKKEIADAHLGLKLMSSFSFISEVPIRDRSIRMHFTKEKKDIPEPKMSRENWIIRDLIDQPLLKEEMKLRLIRSLIQF